MKKMLARSISLAVVTLIIGLVVGFGLTRWSDRHSDRIHGKVAAAAPRHQARPNSAVAQNPDGWDPMAEMDRMQRDIDRAIQHATQQMRFGSSFQLPDFNGDGTAGFTSALDVRDRGDHFEVRADLPNTDQKDVKVTTEGDRQVHVNVTQHAEQKKNANGGETAYHEFGSYDELVTLPAAADMKDMKVDNRNGELVITIPKAKAS
jgi:HSP20 family molecular chaperone IbpA